jgi:hypothetical protein
MDPMNENRIAPQLRVLKAGTLEFGGGAIDRTVRNFSESRAALDVTSPLGSRRNSHWFCQLPVCVGVVTLSGAKRSGSASRSIEAASTAPEFLFERL